MLMYNGCMHRYCDVIKDRWNSYTLFPYTYWFTRLLRNRAFCSLEKSTALFKLLITILEVCSRLMVMHTLYRACYQNTTHWVSVEKMSWFVARHCFLLIIWQRNWFSMFLCSGWETSVGLCAVVEDLYLLPHVRSVMWPCSLWRF